MNETEIKKTIINIFSKIAPEVDFDEVDAEEDLREQIDIDSMDFLNFVVALNEKIGIEIPEEDYGKLTSLNDIVRYVKDHMAAESM